MLAIAKADAICARGDLDADILITGDQVVSWNGQICEKPTDEADARRMLRDYRHSSVEIIPSVVVRNLHTGQQPVELQSPESHLAISPRR